MFIAATTVTPSLKAFLQSIFTATFFIVLPIATALIMISSLDKIARS